MRKPQCALDCERKVFGNSPYCLPHHRMMHVMPADIAADAAAAAAPPASPTVSSTKPVWIDYAVSLGMDRGDAERKTKRELMADANRLANPAVDDDAVESDES